MSQTLESLRELFGTVKGVSFEERVPGFPVLKLECAESLTEISLYGGHVLRFIQKENTVPVVWLSSKAILKAGKAIRGGIPVCFPWFGPREGLPQHGFARTSFWTLESVKEGLEHQERFVVRLTLSDTESSRKLWNHAFKLTLVVRCGKDFNISLAAENTGSEPFVYGSALHTYLGLGDIARAQISGLDGIEYEDETQDMQRFVQQGKLEIDGEIDRCYRVGQPGNPLTVSDFAAGRAVRVLKMGSDVTTVWNPGPERAHQMSDFGDDEYLNMVCVEAVTANGQTLDPGICKVMSQYIYTEKL